MVKRLVSKSIPMVHHVTGRAGSGSINRVENDADLADRGSHG